MLKTRIRNIHIQPPQLMQACIAKDGLNELNRIEQEAPIVAKHYGLRIIKSTLFKEELRITCKDLVN